MGKQAIVLIITYMLSILVLRAQDSKCPGIKVGVEKGEMSDAFLQKIINDNPDQSDSKDYWLSKINDILIKALISNNPSVTFTTAGSGESYEYVFKYQLSLSDIAEGDYDFVESIVDEFSTKYYVMRSTLTCLNPCGPKMFAGLVITNSRKLNVVVEANVMDHLSIDKKLKKYEQEHLVPPRAPEITVEMDPKFVSPLKGERTLRIKAKVLNCEGKPVYSTLLDQNVYYSPQKNERGYNKLPRGFGGGSGSLMGGGPESNTLVVFTNAEGKAEAEFNLKKGIDEEILPVSITTCGLVSFFIKEEKELIIRGLKIEVKPDRKEIEPDERTKIVITFNETDPDGTKYPVEGKKIDVKINGLVNGTIKPQNDYTTNSEGKVVLNYIAGSNDEKITVNASFQPEDYPDKTEGKGSVKVKKLEGDFNGTITYKREVHWKAEESSVTKSVNLSESATLQVAAKYLKTIAGDDGPEELFEASPLSGNYSVTMKKVTIATDVQGHWQKQEDTWQGDKTIDPKSNSNIFLTIKPQNKSYRLQIEFRFPPVEGNTAITTDEGVSVTYEPEVWGINAGLEFEGKTDGNSVNGNWSKPAPNKLFVLPGAGLMPGATWNWNLSRKK